MFLTKIKIAAVVLLTLGLLGTGVSMATQEAPAASAAPQSGKAKPGQAKTDQDRIQGVWIPRSLEKGGRPAPKEILTSTKMKFAGDKLIADSRGKREEITFTLRPKRKPKEIDLLVGGRMVPGIYELRGDELKLCLNDPGQERPTEFKTAADSQQGLLVLRREKPARGKAVPPRDDLKDETDPAKLRQRIKELERELQQAREELRLTQAKLKDLQALAAQSREEAQAERERAALRAFAEERAARLHAERKKADEEAKKLADTQAARQEVINRLKQMALAMYNYRDTMKALPAAAVYSKDGKPLLSWRVALLPYLDQQELYTKFKLDEPWDSPHNKKLLQEMPKVFAPATGKSKASFTPYRVFTGKDTVFPGKEGVRLQDILDGTSQTLLIVEAAEGVPWTKPDELPYDAKKPLPKLGGMFKGGFYLAMCDGSVHFVRTPLNPPVFRLLITRDDGEAVDFDKLSK